MKALKYLTNTVKRVNGHYKKGTHTQGLLKISNYIILVFKVIRATIF